MKNLLSYVKFKSRKLVIYLHGGPNFTITNENDDPFVMYLLNNKINTLVINYPFVIGDGGVSDLKFVKKLIRKLIYKYEKYEIIILGESYGGYLASLLLDIPKVRKIIIISGFISLEYQYLFSTERIWLKEYMSQDAPDFFKIQQKYKNKLPIVFIQGTLDDAVPIIQFSAFIQENVDVKKFKSFRHREQGRKLETILKVVLQVINT